MTIPNDKARYVELRTRIAFQPMLGCWVGVLYGYDTEKRETVVIDTQLDDNYVALHDWSMEMLRKPPESHVEAP